MLFTKLLVFISLAIIGRSSNLKYQFKGSIHENNYEKGYITESIARICSTEDQNSRNFTTLSFFWKIQKLIHSLSNSNFKYLGSLYHKDIITLKRWDANEIPQLSFVSHLYDKLCIKPGQLIKRQSMADHSLSPSCPWVKIMAKASPIIISATINLLTPYWEQLESKKEIFCTYSVIQKEPRPTAVSNGTQLKVPMLKMWLVRIYNHKDIMKARMRLQFILATDSPSSRITQQFLINNKGIFKGFAVLCTERAKKTIEKWTDYVKFIQQNFHYTIDDSTSIDSPRFVNGNSTNTNHFKRRAYTAQEIDDRSAWGLARISTRDSVVSSKFMKRSVADPYRSVHLYIMDSGINEMHPEFQTASGTKVSYHWRYNSDLEQVLGSHGTEVASVAAGNDLGVSPLLKIMDFNHIASFERGEKMVHSVSLSETLQQMWHHYSAARVQDPDLAAIILAAFEQKDVANDLFVGDLIDSLFDEGIPFVVSSGNNPDVRTENSQLLIFGDNAYYVASIDRRNNIAQTSTLGRNLDIFAPGVDVSVATTDPYRIVSKSGTSYAAPMAAGVMSNILANPDFRSQFSDEYVDVNHLYRIMKCTSTRGQITGRRKSELESIQDTIVFNAMSLDDVIVQGPLSQIWSCRTITQLPNSAN